ncbi:cullin-associated NEDD8-dissociated protein 1 [Acyrthosiphon pisum]|uniref:TATA-binding protein interacting (TIP20) domain-containing protein n=1 Tax=Acyrthosiphon pisum TaxID=7029 RepID=A0A8R1W3E0_ACYPI|nr:cullin-associated NEDD8-dissociated protein 1 [Acyrthosiphon pisum]|eukprot:XP_001948086.1 PREDICTED: cullin-associated NEDD8-dissociated protein 1 [Acyrthosiphon pisum]
MANVSYQIANLLEKMNSTDKDFRFMATNDLMSELQKDSIKLDDDSERKVVKMLLRLLEDKNGEVQNLAVKCLGPLVNKVKETQVETIVDALCTNMISENEQLRDICSIGLKTVISELPIINTSLAANVCRRITGKLTSAIEKQDVSVQLEALDILADLLSRFGSLLLDFHSGILKSLLPQLNSSRQAVRKRTIVALGHLVLSCNQLLYIKLIDYLVNDLSVQQPAARSKTLIQCIAAICRQAGHRFGVHIDRVVPLIKGPLMENSAEDDELREYCLQAFDAFVNRCPSETAAYTNDIIKLCLEYLAYDPNYNYDDNGENGDENLMDTTDGEELEDEYIEDDYSDDDDMSWKVRRSAAKCLEGIIITRKDLIADMYRNVSKSLIQRFKEREENVKSDILHVYMTLLKQTKLTSSNTTADMADEDSAMYILQSQVPAIVKAIHAQMKERSVKTRTDCLALLKELVIVLPGALTNHIGTLIPGIQYSLSDKKSSSNMKIDTLSFIYCVLTSHAPEIFHPWVEQLIPPIITAVGDPFYKITAEALIVLQEMVKVIRPLDNKLEFNFVVYAVPLYNCTYARLKTSDIDQEVKERSISCMGQIICNLGDVLQNELQVCLPIFLDRLRNEITRLTTVKALIKVAGSPLKIDLTSILTDGVLILASFLRKNQRALKLSTLTLLNMLLNNFHADFSADLLKKILIELPQLINESDLHIAQLTLSLLTTIIKIQPFAMSYSSSIIMPEIMTLTKSPLLQGAALNAILLFFQSLVATNVPQFGYQELVTLLISPLMAQPVGTPALTLHKQAYHSLAKCVAALTATQPTQAMGIINSFMSELINPTNDQQHIFSLLVIGEVGRHIDLSSVANLKETILQSFSSNSEEIKSSASYSLGSISIGNLEQYLPFILREIDMQPKRQYLLLHSLKEIITFESSTPNGIENLKPFVPAIWQQLFKHCECTEEGSRNVVAECLGKLTLIDPYSLLPNLQLSLSSSSALMRTTLLTAVKFTISDQPQPIDMLLRQNMDQFLSALTDPDINVRRVTLIAFNSAAHNKPSLVRDLLDTVLPKLYAETIVKKELIREVEMGPFKHTVDDGLDIRKAAFECMYTLLDSCLDRLDIFEYLNYLENGLRDHYDIKMLTYLMVSRMAQIVPSAVLQRLDKIVEPLKQTCMLKIKANSVKQEFEKMEELKRSAMRAVINLQTIPDSDKNPHMSDFVCQIKSSPELNTIYENIQKDSSGTVSDNHTTPMEVGE